MSQPIIVYDLDGTLIDTAPDLLETLERVVVADGLDDPDKEILRAHVGFGGRVMLSHAYANAKKHLPEAKLDRLLKEFIEVYAENMPGSSVPFDGLMDSMENLKAAGFKFAVCTNKTEFLAKKLLAELDMDHWFDVITGQDTFSVRKPHPAHLLKTIEMMGADPLNAVMVGDTPTDFSTAKSASVPVIAVEFGYCAEPLAQFDPDKIISHFNEMTPEMVTNLVRKSQA